MKNILHISASARAEESASYRLSQQIVAQLRKAHPDAQVVSRDLWAEPLPHVDFQYANALARHQGGAPHAQGLAGSRGADRRHLQRYARGQGRHTGGSSGLHRRQLRRLAHRRARPPAGFPGTLPARHLAHHRPERLHFFSLQALAAGPEATTAAHAAVEQELAQHFAV